MRVRRFGDIEAFAARVESYLLMHEATHCLMLGLLAMLPREPLPAEQAPYMAVVEEGDAITLVAMRTPPFNLILSLAAPQFAANLPEALALLAGDVWARYQTSLPGVLGPVPLSRQFTEHWQQRSGRRARLSVNERIYQLDAVTPGAGVAGSYRHPTEADRDLLVRWLAAFADEALAPGETLDANVWVDHFFASPTRGGFLWVDAGGVPVSFAAYGNPTAHGIRIGPVYTPPEQRGHGYASACVATLSQQLLDSGRTFCFLFTDLANPTSNHIYATIGYRPVSDVDVYEFAGEN
jgi:uncharacterized protein